MQKNCKRFITELRHGNPYTGLEAVGYDKALTDLLALLEEPLEPEDVEILTGGYGLKTETINYYHLRIRHEEYEGHFEWYHTTGTIVATRYGGSARIGRSKDPETVAEIIIKHVQKND